MSVHYYLQHFPLTITVQLQAFVSIIILLPETVRLYARFPDLRGGKAERQSPLSRVRGEASARQSTTYCDFDRGLRTRTSFLSNCHLLAGA